MSNISAVLGDIFRFMYSGLLHCFCGICRTYSRNRRRRIRRLRAGKIKSTFDTDCVGTATLDPSWPEAQARIQQTAIDDGNVQEQNRRADDWDSDSDSDEQDDMWDRMESRVPFGAVILIFFGYTFLGAFMFNRFEGWPMRVSVYFSYITLATVGFGDYVSDKLPSVETPETKRCISRFLVSHQVQHPHYDSSWHRFTFCSVYRFWPCVLI